MNKKILTALATTLILGASSASFAHGKPDTEPKGDPIYRKDCDAAIADVSYQINNQYALVGEEQQFFGKRVAYDYASLMDKLDAVQYKLNDDKFVDADLKASQLQDKLDSMNGGGKKKLEDDGHYEITLTVNDVVACIDPYLPPEE